MKRVGASYHYVTVGDGNVAEVIVRGRAGAYDVEIDNRTVLSAEGCVYRDGRFEYRAGGRRHLARIGVRRHAGESALVSHHDLFGPLLVVSTAEQTLLGRNAERTASARDVRAPMPGRLAELRVAVCDTVAAGQCVPC